MAFKLLLTENESALGAALYHALEAHPYPVVCPGASFDWQAPEAVAACLAEHAPSLIISTLPHAPLGAEASRGLAEGCASRGATVIHLSSYEVFGTDYRDTGLNEADRPEPDNDRGRALLAAEDRLLERDNTLVVRLPWLVGERGDNLLTRVCQQLIEQRELVVSDHCRGCPLTPDDAQRVVIAFIQQIFCGAENWGVFHLHTVDSCSEAEFVDYVARILEREEVAVGPWQTSPAWQDRLMPGCALLSGARCTDNFGIQLRSWRQGIKPLVKRWLARREAAGDQSA